MALPSDRTIPNAHARAIVAAAVEVAMARQAQQAAEEAFQLRIQAGETSPNMTAMVLTAVNLAQAVDVLTQTCVAAQVAHDAQSN